jgi:hypothetical protein
MTHLPKEAEERIEAIAAQYTRQTNEQLQVIDRLQERLAVMYPRINDGGL